jgi:hypothetical protein
LLNGQTIYNCRETYKDFWSWLQGEVAEGYVRSVTATKYEEEIAEYGFCGAFVISNNDVRLPDYRNAFLMGGDASNNGTAIAAGLPNITGTLTSLRKKLTGTFYNISTTPDCNVGAGGDITVAVENGFDASRSNPIFGNSDTVQPPTLCVSWCIQVFNVSTGLSTQESAQLASQMQMKAQTDLANTNSNIDFVVESWNDGQGNWYRLYRSGWLEQGGKIAYTANPTITLFKEFRNTNYHVFLTDIDTSDTGGMASQSAVASQTTTTLTLSTTSEANFIFYEAKGFAAV